MIYFAKKAFQTNGKEKSITVLNVTIFCGPISCGTQNHSTILYDIPAAMLEVYTHKIQMIPAPHLATPVVIAHLSPVPQPRHLEVKPLPPHLSPHRYIPKKTKFRIFTMSCQSIRKKGKNINVLIETTSPDVIITTETCLSYYLSSHCVTTFTETTTSRMHAGAYSLPLRTTWSLRTLPVALTSNFFLAHFNSPKRRKWSLEHITDHLTRSRRNISPKPMRRSQL